MRQKIAAQPSGPTFRRAFHNSDGLLAGHAARMITGVALTVDGGVLVKNDTPYEEYFRRR